ncbi:MAG: hypothetical protein QXI59_04700 [Candidatus Bathyarchaeia archaeon]|nr:hypothetical protein [Candidatus Bathyarchaeota archaeon]
MVDFRRLSEHHLRRLAADYPESASYPGALERKILVIWNFLNEKPPCTIEEYSMSLKEGAKKELERRLEEERRRRAELEAKEAKRRTVLIKKLKRWLVGIEEPITVIEETGHLEWKCPVCGNKAKFDLKEHIDSIAKGGSTILTWSCSGKDVVEGPPHWGLTREVRLAQGEEISRKILERE